jgi:S-adenosylmethionine:tRNA ribosyltransferase-isomerase
LDPRDINIQAFTYLLRPERIATFPLPERDASKLLIYQDGQVSEDIYRNIADHIPSGTTLVFNDTRVVEARILFQKPTGGVIEIFALDQLTSMLISRLPCRKQEQFYGNV